MARASLDRRARAFLAGTMAVAVAAACDDGSGPVVDPPPRVTSALVVDEGGPIFRSLAVTLDEPAAVEVFYRPLGADSALYVASEQVVAEHELLLPRLLPDTTYEYAVRALELLTQVFESEAEVERGTFTTGSLPDALPELDVLVEGQAGFPLLMLPIRAAEGEWSGQLALDTRTGAIVWYAEAAGGTLVATPVPGSHDMVFIQHGFDNDPGPDGIVRLTPEREVIALLEAGDGDFGRIHHDLAVLDEERVLFLARDVQMVGDTEVTGEALWEWNMTTGALDKRWSAFDHLDWNTDRTEASQAINWLHANSLAIGPRGNVVVSFRNISQVVSIAPDFQSFEWRLGGPNATAGLSDEDRFVQQHSAWELPGGRVLLFDNQGGGAADDRSRGLELQLDGDTAYAVWQYVPEPPIFARLRGGAYRLDSGNTLTVMTPDLLEAHEADEAGARVWRLRADAGSSFRAAPWPGIAGEVRVGFMP